jgi:uncharacterized membrane protein
MTMTVTETEGHWAMLACLGAIFLGPVAPLLVLLAEGRRSPFVRQHVVQALNLTLTFLLYGVSALIVTGLLALDTLIVALAVMAPVFLAGWLVMLTQLIRGAAAATRGTFRELPRWMCATLVH